VGESGSRQNATTSDWYFHGPSGSSKRDIRIWWRARRFRYNRDLFFIGVGTWLLVLFAGSAAVKPGVDFEEPIMMINRDGISLGRVIFSRLCSLPFPSLGCYILALDCGHRLQAGLTPDVSQRVLRRLKTRVSTAVEISLPGGTSG
jgi:hypothetical protein